MNRRSWYRGFDVRFGKVATGQKLIDLSFYLVPGPRHARGTPAPKNASTCRDQSIKVVFALEIFSHFFIENF